MADLDLRIDQLPLGTPGPNDPIPFRDLVSGVTKKFLAGLVLPSPTTTDIEWDPDAAAAGDYDANEIVTYGGNIYQSEINNNTSVPGTNADWTLLTRGSGGISFWEAGVFLEDEIIKAYDLPGVGPRFFRLDPAEPRPFNSTDFETELAADTWIRMYNENFWPLSGSANLSGAVTITAGSGEDIDLLGSSPRFNVQRDGNRSVQFQIDPETGAFGNGGLDLTVVDPGTTEGTFLRFDDIEFKVGNDRAGNDFAGIEYAADYSASYTNRSLVDKEYVDGLTGNGYSTLTTDTTQTGNVGTGEDTLFTYSLPAGTLAANGDSVVITVSGTYANTLNDKRLKVKFGGTTIVNVNDTSTSNGVWSARIEIIRTGATSQKCSAIFLSSTTTNDTAFYEVSAETLSGTVTILVTGEATSNDDIVGEMFKVKFEP